MGRPSTVREETIIRAAREVFLARGIRATAAEVAERAGVSEGSIFNRFKTKLELFAAAMRSQIDEPAWGRTLEAGKGRSDVREVLVEAGHEVLAFYRTILPLMMMSWSNPSLEGSPCGMTGTSPPPLKSLRRVARFFEAQAKAGRIAEADPEVLARAYLGALHSFVLLELLEASPAPGALSPDAFVREHVRLLWEGIAPPRAGARAGQKRPVRGRINREDQAKT